MITEQFAQEFATDWIAGWNAHDLDRVMAHYHEDVSFSSPLITKINNDPSGTITNAHNLRSYFENALKAYPGLHFEYLQTLVANYSIVLYYRSVNNLFAAELMEFNEKGKVVRVLAHYAK